MTLNRRTFMASVGIGLGTAEALAKVGPGEGGLSIECLRVQCLEHPLGLEEVRPHLSWRLTAAGRGVRQKSYRIRVASSLERLQAGIGDLWDSATVTSANSFNIAYQGVAPVSRQRCFWNVEVVDNRGRRRTSAPSWWEMGLLSRQDWQASWLVVEDAAGKAHRAAHGGDAKGYPVQPAMAMRRAFHVVKPVLSARLYATALGAYEARINGKRVGNARLAPEITDTRKRVLYQVYDVTDLVTEGDNLIGALVGAGWYGSAYTWTATPYMFGPPPCRFMAQLELTHPDGTTMVIGTDRHWRIAPSAIRLCSIYDGEAFDARKQMPGWDATSFDDTPWAEAEIGEAPAATLVAQVSPPIREIMTLAPVAITSPRPGVQVFDFGQNFAGWARLKTTGPAGTEIQLRFAEVLKPDGNVDQSNLRSAKANDTFILRGDPGGEVYEPYFTYHGFRYVEVSGLPAAPSPDTLIGVVAHSDLAVTGRFLVGHPVIQKFWQNALWSERSNFFAIPTDCPQRDERMGWCGDAQVFWDAASFNMDTAAFTDRFMDDVRAGQGDDGAFPEVTPHDVPEMPMRGAPGWADAGVILPWAVFRHYGDTAIIDRNWQAMSRWMAFLEKTNPDLVRRRARGTDYGDWLAVDAKNPNDETTPKDLIGTAFWTYNADLMARMAKATGRDADCLRYRSLGTRLRAAFRSAFVKADGLVGNGSQTSCILPLAFDLLPQPQRRPVAERLAADIARRGTRLSTGFLGTPYILDALAANGFEDLAIALLLQTGYPSWGYMVMKGATTMWERWNSDTGDVSMNSYNHYAYGAIVSFLYRRIAGIDMGVPGGEPIAIRPICDPRLKFAAADYDSVYGRISSHWRRDDGLLRLEVTIPANAEATIAIPTTGTQTVRESGRLLAAAKGIKIASRASDRILVATGSGTYRFAVG